MLIFLKLGGSLITEKEKPHTPRQDVISRLAEEISSAFHLNPSLKLILGHGSGSFGHIPAKIYHTRSGVFDQIGWKGFVEVWREARALNQIVVDGMLKAGLKIISFPPSASLVASDGKISTWNIEPILKALHEGIVPIIAGDVAFDSKLGGTIISTEELFDYLARQVCPQRILLAGLEEGVWADYPQKSHLVTRITPSIFPKLASVLEGSSAPDVTGGMIQKVRNMVVLTSEIAGLKAVIFSGEQPGVVLSALMGAMPGTSISQDDQIKDGE